MIDRRLFIGHHGSRDDPHPPAHRSDHRAPCCEPLSSGRLDAEQATALARRLKLLADPTRLRLLSILLDSEAGQACTCNLTGPFGLSQPTVTHHLQRLAEAGIVHGERRGRRTYYSVDKRAIDTITAALQLGS